MEQRVRFELTVFRICSPLHWASLPPLHDCWSEYKDSNLGPSAPKADALSGCAILRVNIYMQTYSTQTGTGLQVQFSISDSNTGLILIYNPRTMRLRMFYFTEIAAAVRYIRGL